MRQLSRFSTESTGYRAYAGCCFWRASSDLYTVQSFQEAKRLLRPGSQSQSQSKKSKVCAHPTREEVATYCRERGNRIEPQQFFDFYSSNGWRVGRNPMKDWKAAVRNWERKGGYTTNDNGRPSITEVIEREQAIARARAN